MKSLISFNENELQLNSCMDESIFGRTNLASVLTTDAGIYACFENNQEEITFESWHFSRIKADETGKVIFCGPAFAGVPLSEIFESGNQEEIANAVYKTAFVILKAIQEGIQIPSVGAGAILIAKTQILFLPKTIFENSSNGLSQNEKALQTSFYQFKGLTDKQAIKYMLGVIAYRAIANEFPFSQQDEAKRQSDILDAHFLPLEYNINGINKKLAYQINSILDGFSTKKKSSVSKTIQDKENTSNSNEILNLDLLKSELGLQADGSFKKNERSNAVSNDEFSKRKNDYFTKNNKKIERNRFIRRNKITLIISGIIAVIVFSTVKGQINRLGELPTTKGLTAAQSAELFYTGFHNLDVEMMMESGKGSDATEFENIVSALNVTYKTRSAYDAKTYIPERWLNMAVNSEKNMNSWICGVSNLVIRQNGQPDFVSDLNPQVTTRNQKPAEITQNGAKIAKGQTQNLQAEYYAITSKGEDNILTIEHRIENITCTFKGGRWILTSIKTQSNDISEMPLAELKESFAKALVETNNNCANATTILAETYPWIPSAQLVKDEGVRLLKDMKSFNF